MTIENTTKGDEKNTHPMLAVVANDSDIQKVLTQGLLEPVESPRCRIFYNGVEVTGGAVHLLIELFYTTKVADGQPDAGRVIKNHIGVVEYGQPPNPDGGKNPPDTCRITGPGGVVSALYTIVAGRLYLAMIEERRTLEHHPSAHPKAIVYGMPRGYLFKPGGSAMVAAVGEVREEVGKLPNLNPITSLGESYNVDNAWFDYTLKSDGSQGGVDVVLFEIDPRLLIPNGDKVSFRLNEQYPREKGSPWEKIVRCVFAPWQFVVGQRDGMSSLGFARVMGALFASGRLQMTVSATPPTR